MNAARAARGAANHRCGRCGARYEGASFSALTSVQTFAGRDLTAHVVHWPADVVVEVRACARCATPIARLARPA